MFCTVEAAQSFQIFDCEPASSCSDWEGTKGRNHHSANNEQGALKVKTYILHFRICHWRNQILIKAWKLNRNYSAICLKFLDQDCNSQRGNEIFQLHLNTVLYRILIQALCRGHLLLIPDKSLLHLKTVLWLSLENSLSPTVGSLEGLIHQDIIPLSDLKMGAWSMLS